MHLGFRLSSKPLLTSDDYELGAGVRKRHKAPEEDPDALGGTGKARGRSQPWDEHEASSDFMSQVSFPPQAPIFQAQKVWCVGGCVCARVLPPSAGPLALLLPRDCGWRQLL